VSPDSLRFDPMCVSPNASPDLSVSRRPAGVLAVTRSLGDSSMKEFVVGAPYTTETALDQDDEFLIVACDGVSREWQMHACLKAIDRHSPDMLVALGCHRRPNRRRLDSKGRRRTRSVQGAPRLRHHQLLDRQLVRHGH
jgi:hypothetical protein